MAKDNSLPNKNNLWMANLHHNNQPENNDSIKSCQFLDINLNQIYFSTPSFNESDFNYSTSNL